MQLEHWDATAKVDYDQRAPQRARLAALHRGARTTSPIVGPVGVGKTFLAHALGHIACRRGVLGARRRAPTDAQDAQARAPRQQSHETELRKLLAVDLLIVDDFGARRDGRARRAATLYEIIIERTAPAR